MIESYMQNNEYVYVFYLSNYIFINISDICMDLNLILLRDVIYEDLHDKYLCIQLFTTTDN